MISGCKKEAARKILFISACGAAISEMYRLHLIYIYFENLGVDSNLRQR